MGNGEKPLKVFSYAEVTIGFATLDFAEVQVEVISEDGTLTLEIKAEDQVLFEAMEMPKEAAIRLRDFLDYAYPRSTHE